MSEPKRHHYLSQFYLAGFTLSNDKEGDLFCYNVKSKLVRPSKPINEAYIKHFNRIESNQEDPNILEKELSKMEAVISQVIKNIEGKETLPKGEEFNELIYYVALLSIRNPAIRNIIKEVQEDITSRMLELMVSDRNIWEVEMKKINDKSNNKFKNITYEQMQNFYKENRLISVEPNESKIAREFKSVRRIQQLLMKRNWILLINKCSSEFLVSSDRPVKLIPKDLNNIKFGVGFGTRDADLYFPLSKKILLQGSFSLPSTVMPIQRVTVATLNSLQYFYTSRFIYSPTSDFIVIGNNNSIVKATAI